MTRRFLRSVCRLLAAVVLMAQLAVSAHACPGLAAIRMQMTATVSSAGDRSGAWADVAAAEPAHHCEGMADATHPPLGNLCAAHCHYGEQSDQTAAVKLPPTLFTALFYAAPPSPAIGPTTAPPPAALAARPWPAASPPLAILHCCFRI